MQRVDGTYLYQIGSQIHPLSDIHAWATKEIPATTYSGALSPLFIAEAALEPLISRSVFRLRTSVQAGTLLLAAIRGLRTRITEMSEADRDKNIDFIEAFGITTPLQTFEAILHAELSLLPLYVVTQKAGFDTAVLIESGILCFPLDVRSKAPEAVSDFEQGTRCIAFELPTAAGFHLHRANESVLRRYWDAVTKGQPRPASRNMGDYLTQMDQRNVGDPRVKAALKDLKDLHRNPLIHPEHSLQSVDEAIALMNSIHTVVMYMLQEIPQTVPSATLPVGAAATAVVSPPVPVTLINSGP